jgi:hypothetical protein
VLVGDCGAGAAGDTPPWLCTESGRRLVRQTGVVLRQSDINSISDRGASLLAPLSPQATVQRICGAMRHRLTCNSGISVRGWHTHTHPARSYESPVAPLHPPGAARVQASKQGPDRSEWATRWHQVCQQGTAVAALRCVQHPVLNHSSARPQVTRAKARALGGAHWAPQLSMTPPAQLLPQTGRPATGRARCCAPTSSSLAQADSKQRPPQLARHAVPQDARQVLTAPALPRARATAVPAASGRGAPPVLLPLPHPRCRRQRCTLSALLLPAARHASNSQHRSSSSRQPLAGSWTHPRSRQRTRQHRQAQPVRRAMQPGAAQRQPAALQAPCTQRRRPCAMPTAAAAAAQLPRATPRAPQPWQRGPSRPSGRSCWRCRSGRSLPPARCHPQHRQQATAHGRTCRRPSPARPTRSRRRSLRSRCQRWQQQQQQHCHPATAVCPLAC